MWNIIAVVLVLAVTAFALIQVFGVFSSGSDQMSQQSMQSSVASAIGVVTNSYSVNHDFTGFNDTVAKNIGAVPTGWGGTGPFNVPSGGTLSFASATVNGQANAGYTMTFTNVTPNVCKALGSLSIPQLAAIKLNSTQYSNPVYGGSSSPWPPTPAQIAQACGSSSATPATVVLTLI
jgi:hypothetical protein